MKKKIIYYIFSIFVFCFLLTNVEADTINKDNVPNSTYIIGTHMFTRETNDVYEGQLTTKLIMMASKTIEGDSLDDMIVYYKNARGKWINGLSGSEIAVSENFDINYTNLALNSENDTVKAPKKPIIFWDTAQTYNKEEGTFSAWMWVLLDDVNDKTNKVDGVELRVLQNGNFSKDYDLTYKEYFKDSTLTINKDFTRDVEGIVIGNTYHQTQFNIKNITVGQGDGYVTINARAYVLDENGKKVYSDMLVDSISDDEYLPVVKVKSSHSNPSYVEKESGYYYYQLEIEKTEGWSSYSVNRDSYAYILYEKVDGKIQSHIGVFDLDEKVIVTVPKNKIVTYSAEIGYYNKNGDFVHYSFSAQPDKTLIIDTRTLTAPVLNGNQEGMASSDLIQNGEYLRINSDFYKSQEESSLDYNIIGTEIYEITYNIDGTKKYKLIESKGSTKHVYTAYGHAMYVARVYATNSAGEKVYSDFSNIVEMVRTPKIEVSEVKDGKVNVSIVNFSEYGLGNVGYKVYTDNGVELKTVNSVKDTATIDVSETMNIYVRAYATFGQEEDSVYSAKSNRININLSE